ncbi:hypothetical protein BLOT_009818 [Blomia tropicalis]|nr:hypothetical protein BLOT_009818 [Blomia tropicalis]
MDTSSNSPSKLQKKLQSKSISTIKDEITKDLSKVVDIATKKALNNTNVNEIISINKQIQLKLTILCESINDTINDTVYNNLEQILDKKLNNFKTTPQNNSLNFRQATQPQTTIINRKEEEKTLIIKAKSNNNTTSVQNSVLDTIKKLRTIHKNVKINNIVKTHTGVVIKTPKNEDIDSLIAEFAKGDYLSSNANIYKAKQLDPVIVLKKVNKITNPNDIPDIISNMNDTLNNMKEQIKTLFTIKSNTDSHDIVLRVSPNVYSLIKNLKHIYTDYQQVEWRNKILVRQCQKCYALNPNHNVNNCPNQTACNKCDKSGSHDCDNQQKCFNCTKHPYFKTTSVNHKPNNTDCPLYKRQHDSIIQRTCFNPDLDVTEPPIFSTYDFPQLSINKNSKQ